VISNDLVSVILPCRNQADHIGRVLDGYFVALDGLGLPYELVVVPNASTDGTWDVVERISLGHPQVRVVDNPLGGWGLSVRTGLAAARGSILVYTNTARTDPAMLPDFVRRYSESGVGLVKARRSARHSLLRATTWRRSSASG
jgi:glycosyltransferase involved in cell wall biosynthesis